MVEPVTASMASATAKAATTATEAATSAGSAAPTAGGAAARTVSASQQTQIVRQLASATLKSAEMRAVGDSEIIDEFATPIYAGLAAAPTVPTTNSSSAQVHPRNGTFPEVAGPSGRWPGDISGPQYPLPPGKIPGPLDKLPKLPGDIGIPKMPIPTDKWPDNSKIPLPHKIDPGKPFPVEHREVMDLLLQQYPVASIREQMDAGHQRIVVDRTMLEEKVAVNGPKHTAYCLIEERVIDRKYLEHGHLTDLIAEIRHGNIPTIRQVYLAIIDLANLATFKVFQPLLRGAQLESATYRLRQIAGDFEHKVLDSPLAEKEKETFSIDRKLEERGWFKTDHVSEKVGHKEVETMRQLEIKALNVTDLTTVQFSQEQLEAFKSQRREWMAMLQDEGAVARIENALPPEAVADINRKALAWVHESMVKTTTRYSTTEEFNRALGADLDGFLGKRVEMSDKQIRTEVQHSFSEYLSPSDNINLEKIDTFRQAAETFSAVERTAGIEFDARVVDEFIAPGEEVAFKEGWITYIPGGSLANLGVKADLGCKLTGWDLFWAGVDVATIALAIGSVAAHGAKGVAQGVAKGAAEGTAKAVATSASRTVAKQSGRVALKTTGNKAGQSIAMAGLPKPKPSLSLQGAVPKATAKNQVIQRGKVHLQNAGKAGTKATPAVDISKPEVTYKNVPRTNGKWMGTPGDSTWKPAPTVRPANPKANPHGKTNAQILKENHMEKGIEFKKGYPDFSTAVKNTVKLDKMTTGRPANFGQADSLLAQKVRAGKAGPEIEANLREMGVNPSNATKGDISAMRNRYGYTWHEHQDKQTMQLISKELHGTVSHKGGISVLKEEARMAAASTETDTAQSASAMTRAAAAVSQPATNA